jgi:hypothetical protein
MDDHLQTVMGVRNASWRIHRERVLSYLIVYSRFCILCDIVSFVPGFDDCFGVFWYC